MNYLSTTFSHLIFSLLFSISLAHASSGVKQRERVPDNLPLFCYDTLIVFETVEFETNSGLVALIGSEIFKTQLDRAWQQYPQVTYDREYPDLRGGKAVIECGNEIDHPLIRKLLIARSHMNGLALEPPTDLAALIKAHQGSLYLCLLADELVCRNEFIKHIKAHPRAAFDALLMSWNLDHPPLVEQAAVQCLSTIPRHFGYDSATKRFNPDLLRQISSPLMEKLLQLVRGARGGDIAALLGLIQGWAEAHQQGLNDEISRNFPFEKVPPELADEVIAIFRPYIEREWQVEECSIYLRSPLETRPVPEGVNLVDVDLPISRLLEGYVVIEPGEFTMGSPRDEAGRYAVNEAQHRVQLTKAFALKRTPVTVGEWKASMAHNPSYVFPNRPEDEDLDACPMQNISWFDAIAYCNQLSHDEGLVPYYLITNEQGIPGTGGYRCDVAINSVGWNGYRLPTEAEWEYGARGGSLASRYGELNAIAWFTSNSGGRTHPVGQKEPNPLGLYDIFGNVWEWC